MIINYKDNKFLIFKNDPLKGRVVDKDIVDKDLAFLEEEMLELESIYKNNEKLLAWAKAEFPDVSGYTKLKRQKIKLEKLLEEVK